MALTVLIIDFFIAMNSIFYSIRVKEIMNPAFLFSIPLCISYATYYFIFRPLYMISQRSYLTFMVGILVFNIIYFGLEYIFGNTSKLNRLSYQKMPAIKVNSKVFLSFILIIGIFSSLYEFKYINGLQGLTNLGNIATSTIRESYVANADQAPFFVKYGKYFLLFATMVYLENYTAESDKAHGIKYKLFLISIVILTVGQSLFTQSRTDLLIAALPLIFLYLRSKYKKSKWKSYVFIIGILMGFIFILATLRVQSPNDPSTGFFSPDSATMQYIGMPLEAFDKWVVNLPGSGSGVDSIEPLQKLFVAIGVINNNTVLAPIGQFNVYSYLMEPYLDFGIVGVGIWSGIISMFSYWLYRKTFSKNGIYLLFYSVYTYSFVMDFFDWQFTITTYVYFLIFIVLITLKIRKKDNI